MNSQNPFDFWYAVNNTELITAPSSRLETFGDTIVNYYLVTELMDSIDKVRIREGHLKALKPEIITPQGLGQMDLPDFGSEARKYADWLTENAGDLRILQYGFRVQKQELKEYVISDNIENVLDRVKSEVEAKDDPLSSILRGVEDPWEVCLLKLMVELVQHSASGNIKDIQNRVRVQEQNRVQQIDQAFLDASRNHALINDLAEMLRKNGLWDKYEDRFFALVRASER
ncbi:MAG: hypothetical protein JXR25_14835 [Pontiellaceae bacterium]|nr:hypothetical protein [Pontiellaceae bacterium]MBN2786096.1 hypothetical protein [Pontiellaceae bacterium]